MIIGLTNARIKFPDIADLVHYLMNTSTKANSPSTGLS